MRRVIVISKLAYFSTLGLPQNRHNFREEVINIKCVFLMFSTLLFEALLILGRTERDIIINAHTSSCKLPVSSCQVLVKLEFSRQIFEK